MNMLEIIHEHFIQIIATIVTLVITPISRHFTKKVLNKYGIIKGKTEARIKQMSRILSISSNFTALIVLIIIWGVDPQNLLVALSSIFAVIGVAMFAQWSMLSNITAGIIIFFTSPFKVGDYIRIIDKEIPFDALVEDVMAFHTHLRTKEGERMSYPNSLFFQRGVMVLHLQSWEEESDE